MIISCRRLALAAALLPLLALSAAAQPRAKAPAFKGIWEPVSYTEDLDLTDVFFVTTEIGWASGEGGTIIHTNDAGATWTAQLGGDPASREPEIDRLRFVDEYRGWAMQGRKLLRTVDGESWEEISTFERSVSDVAFVSGTRGVAAMGITVQSDPNHVQLTTDGGRTWEPIAPCVIKAAIDGLNRTLRCDIVRFHFPTPSVGYLVGNVPCIGVGCGGPPVLGKTEDGGASWRFQVGPGDAKLTALRDVFFTDENNGVVTTSDDKVYLTADGGDTWRGVVATPGKWTRFADPEVGWSFDEQSASFTTNGGARWTSRRHRFPAIPRAFSTPRRDRAYTAGDHGLVFRYRVVPASEPVAAPVITTVAMPAFASPLDEEVAGIEPVVEDLEAALLKVPEAGFSAGCCAPSVNKLGVVLETITRSLPSFLARFKNTNLLVAGLRMLSDLPGRFGDLQSAVAAFGQAGDKAAAQAAVAGIQTAATALQQATKAAFQTEVPPPAPEPTNDEGGSP